MEKSQRKEPQKEIEITEELINKVLDLLQIGVREKRILGILDIDFKTLETIRNQLIQERKNNKTRN